MYSRFTVCADWHSTDLAQRTRMIWLNVRTAKTGFYKGCVSILWTSYDPVTNEITDYSCRKCKGGPFLIWSSACQTEASDYVTTTNTLALPWLYCHLIINTLLYILWIYCTVSLFLNLSVKSDLISKSVSIMCYHSGNNNLIIITVESLSCILILRRFYCNSRSWSFFIMAIFLTKLYFNYFNNIQVSRLPAKRGLFQ